MTNYVTFAGCWRKPNEYMSASPPDLVICPGCGSPIKRIASGELGCMACLLAAGLVPTAEPFREWDEHLDSLGIYTLARREDVDGDLHFEVGSHFTSKGSFVNEGEIDVLSKDDPSFISGDATTTITINGTYTGIGYPLNPNTVGLTSLVAAGPIGDAKMIINGALTNYQASTHTLHQTYFAWEAANGASTTTKVLGGSAPLDIVVSKAALALFGPNTGFRDNAGSNALRNLSTSARLLIGNRDFTTASSFVTTSRLSVFGGTNFTVVRSCLSLSSASILRFSIYNQKKIATMNVKGTAKLAGKLQAGVFDVSKISATDSFNSLTAGKITGKFSNAPSGGRVMPLAILITLATRWATQ